MQKLSPNSHLTLTQLSPNSRPTLSNHKFEFRMIWAFIWYTYWYVTKTLNQLSPNSRPILANHKFEFRMLWAFIWYTYWYVTKSLAQLSPIINLNLEWSELSFDIHIDMWQKLSPNSHPTLTQLSPNRLRYSKTDYIFRILMKNCNNNLPSDKV